MIMIPQGAIKSQDSVGSKGYTCVWERADFLPPKIHVHIPQLHQHR